MKEATYYGNAKYQVVDTVPAFKVPGTLYRVWTFVPDAAGRGVDMPDARTLQNGTFYYMGNVGAASILIRKADQFGIITLSVNQQAVIYLADNSTLAGVWVARGF
jgi:hypothetical protein